MPVRRRPGHHARGDRASSAATRRKINPLAPAELVIDHSVIADVFGRPDAFERNVELEYERNKRALPVPALGPDRVRRVQGRPARHRHRAPGQHRVPGPRRSCRARRRSGLPGHAGRHRLAHHDGQRPRRARLGRRRHRGRGGDARPAGVDADPAGGRLQAAPASCPRAPPPPTSCSPSPRCCASTAWSASSSSSTAPGVAAVPLANRATIGNMSPEFGSTCAIFPIDDETVALPAAHRPRRRAGRAGRGVRQGAGPLARPGAPSRRYSRDLELDLSTVVPSIAGPKRPQDRVVAVATPRPRSAASLRRLRRRRRRRVRVRRGGGRVVPGLRPAGLHGDQRRSRTARAAPDDGGRPSNPVTVTLDGRPSSSSTTARW